MSEALQSSSVLAAGVNRAAMGIPTAGAEGVLIAEAKELIRAHYRMQTAEFISDWQEVAEGILVGSRVSEAPMWNHAAWWGAASEGFSAFLEESVAWHEQAGRRPAVYCVSDCGSDTELLRKLEDSGFERFDLESWMIYGGGEPEAASFCNGLEIRRVTSARELEDFARVFKQSYRMQGDGFREALAKMGDQGGGGMVIDHLIGYAEGAAVCIGTAIREGTRACLYNVGTAPEARRKGYGRAITVALVREAWQRGCRLIFLQADAGSRTEALYQALGFEVAFSRVGFHGRGRGYSHMGALKNAGVEYVGDALTTWMQRLSGMPRARDGQRDWLQVAYPESVTAILKGLEGQANRRRALLAGAWALLLGRYADAERVAFGIEVQGSSARPNWTSQGIVVGIDENKTVRQWLTQIERGMADIDFSRDGMRIAFDSALLMASDPAAEVPSSGGSVVYEIFPMLEDGRFFGLRCAEGYLREASLRRLAGHYFHLLAELAAKNEALVGSLELMPERERRRLLEQAQGGRTNPEPPKTVVELFEEQVRRSPAAIAVELAEGEAGEVKRWTYQRLNERADGIARQLRGRGVTPESMVGICLERSLDTVAALLGVLKSGAACVPLDPEYPKERISFILEDTGAPIVIADRAVADRLPPGQDILWVDDVAQGEPRDTVEVGASPEQLAYVIYTSGSTGKPKGVLIEHHALAAHCLDCQNFYGMSPEDRVLQFSPLNFDASFEQVFTALVSGATLVLRGREIWNVRQFARQLKERELTVADIPTAYWHQLAEEMVSGRVAAPDNLPLRLVIVGGETMLPESLRLWAQTSLKSVRLINAYGPTEATITATAHDVRGEEISARVPIGQARTGRAVYVLDRGGRLLPWEVAGELYIGGPLLARGYLNRPDLVREKFVTRTIEGKSERLYRTGDLGYYGTDGNLQFLGRADYQVKIRGFRIELGEVESALMEHPQVGGAVVVAQEEGVAEKKMVAYVTKRSGGMTLALGDVRGFLKERLPDYMIPAEFVELEEFPLLPSGKVDRKAVAKIPYKKERASLEIKGPQEPLQLQLQLLFERVLGKRPIGVDMSFFELGGNSLQALEVLMEIERVTGRTLPLGTLYQANTVEALAGVLAQEGDGKWSALVPLQASGNRPPLYLVHTTPGDVLGYGNLIYHLGTDQPCYGFQSLGFCRTELCHRTIEDMAAYYIGLLRQHQRSGPYYLGGWCYGGIVAVEMGHQLRAQGETVALLALMETVAPPPHNWNIRYYGHRLECFLRMKPAGWLRYLKEKVTRYQEMREADRMRFRLAGQSEPGVGLEQTKQRLAQLEYVYRANMDALRRYRGKPYPGTVTLFNAEEMDPAVVPDPLYGWPGMAEGIETHLVPGNHDTMLAEPHVAVLADKIRGCLERAQAVQARRGEGCERSRMEVAPL